MKFELTLQDINTVLQALGAAPYAQVFELVTKIRNQAQEQIPQEQDASPKTE